MHAMNSDGVEHISIIGLGETPGCENNFRPRGHEHYHRETDSEGHPIVPTTERLGAIGEGATPRLRYTGSGVVHVGTGIKNVLHETE